ncbi:antitoxin PaaA2 family protein [Acidithiobacillus sulfurivorans]|uniref:Stability determinant n=1 Tax=Acidithiobacillus sulfurivorans TaxID=1958756 RepID=A0ABS5ZXH4_9PROT|nr:stability determinant [Acidithiobacillus sulfurivorans]MBU2759823.1 stability determinant [Acidithiobacillus sulfurivorans]
MNTVLPSIISEFETAEQEASYTAWLQAKTAASMAERLARLRQRKAS